MSRGVRLALLYALFAAIATVANLVTQTIVVRLIDGPWAVQASIVAGTIVGLPVKYFLDKQWIFRYVTVHIGENVRLLILYTATAVITTLVFWGMEWLFQELFGTEAMRLVGGAVGLLIGYVTKYFLDRKYVFRTDSEGGE